MPASTTAAAWTAHDDPDLPGGQASLTRFLVGATLAWTVFTAMAMNWPEYMLPTLLVISPLLALCPPRQLFLALLTTIPVACFSLEPYGALKKTLVPTDLVVLCLAVSWLTRRLARKRLARRSTDADWLVMAFWAWAGVSLVWTSDLRQGVWEFFHLTLAVLTFFLTVAVVRSLEDFKRAAAVLLVVGVVESALCMVAIYNDTIGYDEGRRFLDDLVFHNRMWVQNLLSGRGNATSVGHDIGTFLTLPSMLGIIMLLVSASRRGRVLAVLATLGSMIGVMSTMSKGALGSLWLGVMGLCLLLERTQRKMATCLVASVLAIIVLFLAVMAKDIDRTLIVLEFQTEVGSEKTSAGSRLKWWMTGWENFIPTGGIGNGVGGFRATTYNHVPDGTHAAVLFDLGFPGAILWCLLFLNCFAALWRRLKREPSQEMSLTLAGYICTLAVMLVGWIVTLYYTFADLWLCLGLGYALVKMPSRAAAEDAPALRHRVSLAPALAAWVFPPGYAPPGHDASPPPGAAALPAWAAPAPRPPERPASPPPERAAFPGPRASDRLWRRSPGGGAWLPPRPRGLAGLLLARANPRPPRDAA